VNIPDRWVGWVSAAGLGVAFLSAIVVEAIAIAQSWGGRYWLFGGTAAVAVCVLALLRQRQRAWTAIAGLTIAALAILIARVAGLPAEPGPAMAMGLSVLVGSAIRALPAVPAAAIACGGLAVVAGSQLAARPSTSGIATVAPISGTAWLGAVAVGLSLRLLDDRARSTTEAVRQAERLDLARELHDVVAHHITAMLIQAQAAQVVARRNPGEVAASLTGIEAAGSEAITAMRRVVGLLRDTDDSAPASQGPEQLTALVERFNRQGPAVRLHMPDRGMAWRPEVTSTAYRIVQEALTNVSRHAPHARAITVTVDQDACGGIVEVVNDGPTSSVRHRHRGGYGLIGMRERVEMLGGTLDAGPRPGGGWSVRAVLPASTRESR
jgi:signal transduction histidine kinase